MTGTESRDESGEDGGKGEDGPWDPWDASRPLADSPDIAWEFPASPAARMRGIYSHRVTVDSQNEHLDVISFDESGGELQRAEISRVGQDERLKIRLKPIACQTLPCRPKEPAFVGLFFYEVEGIRVLAEDADRGFYYEVTDGEVNALFPAKGAELEQLSDTWLVLHDVGSYLAEEPVGATSQRPAWLKVTILVTCIAAGTGCCVLTGPGCVLCMAGEAACATLAA